MSDQNCPALATETWNLIKQHNLTNRPLVVALSGGLDSMVMLRVMLELREQFAVPFSALHVNHGLSPNAKSWQAFVETYCEINQIPLTVVNLSLEKRARQSLEQIAREARYANMATLLPEQAVVLTGHHEQDQVETFFLRLTRGSSSKGLSAMAVIADLPHYLGQDKSQLLCRPLLKSTKTTLERYAKFHHLEWIEDESNQDLAFDRNFIRHQVTPILEGRWPHIANAIGTSCEILAEESSLLEEYLSADLQSLIDNNRFGLTSLKILSWQQHSAAKRIQLLRLFLKQLTGSQVNRNQINQLVKTVINAENDRQAFIDIGEFQVRKHAGNLFCFKRDCLHVSSEPVKVNVQAQKNNNEQLTANVRLSSALHDQDRLELIIDLKNHPHRGVSDDLWSIRYGIQQGLKFRPNAQSGSKKVTEYLKQKGCPAWLRGQVPLLFCDEQLVAVINYAIDVQWQDMVRYKLTHT